MISTFGRISHSPARKSVPNHVSTSVAVSRFSHSSVIWRAATVKSVSASERLLFSTVARTTSPLASTTS